jgi:hypothetical protein
MNPRVLTIGVVAKAEEHGVVREFFELFKTSWEFCRQDKRYTVVLHADRGSSCPPADLLLLYGSESNGFDEARKRLPGAARAGAMLSWNRERLPLYGRSVPFPPADASDVVFEDTREPVATVTRCDGGTVVRVGYDLFDEIRFLLTTGQPAAHASLPSLERHIGLLRGWILGAGIPLVEIPPVPAGHRFTVCLTHDLDHPAVRFHKLDHTTLGFLYRSLVGSLVTVCRGQAPIAALRHNVGAVLRLPLVHLGLAEDFWATFRRYLDIERGLGSTFFAIPTKGDPGRTLDGPAPRARASAYGVADIADQVKTLTAAGSEVGVHGIDAWVDSRRGSEERAAVSRVAGAPVTGVRMHWLFFDERSPERIDEGGFAYDSSFGYNDAVGFRAGTLQAFKPLTARQLLELPLHVMDTALFFPSRLGLTREAARAMVWPLVDEAERHGGALTINWHDRSIAPERLWDGFYLDLLGELKRRQPWFPTAAQAVSWFRRRRAARFDSVCQDDGWVHIRASADGLGEAPGLTVRVHTHGLGRATSFTDLPLRDTLDAHVPV